MIKEIIKIYIDTFKSILNYKSNINTNQVNYKNNYNFEQYLLTPTELKFYKILKKITDKYDLSLFVQVALYEIINSKDYRNFNKIRGKTIDFVITEKNCKIKLCIELDDYTHNFNKRIQRDNFINNIFKELNIPLLRIPVQDFYNMDILEKNICELL